jgi:flagellar hook-associated protein 2
MSQVNSTNNMSNVNASRITGMFSGLDIDALVKSMASKQQLKIDQAFQRQQRQTWLKEALGSVRDEINTFMGAYINSDATNSMFRSTTFYSYKVTAASTSPAVSVSATSSAVPGRYSVEVLRLARNASVESAGRISKDGTEISPRNTDTLAQLKFANELQFDANGKISFAINGKTFTFSKDTTLQTFLNTINNDKDANVTIKYSRLTDSFTISSNTGGKDGSVNIRNISGNAFGENSAFQIPEGLVRNGEDAIVVINGTELSRSTNDFTIDGVTFSLKDVTTGKLDFLVERDYSATIDTVKSFVEAYNKLTAKLKELLMEKDESRKYPPLTDAQKKEMKDSEIEAWEKMAKSGLLRNNTTIRNLLTTLRGAFFTALGGTGRSMSGIGITTAGYFEPNAGQLVVDEEKLLKALETDGESVVKMFTGNDPAEKGLIYRFRDAFTLARKNIAYSVDEINDKISDFDRVITRLSERYDEISEKYYNKFAAMETALARLNSQAAFIGQLFTPSR